jgi:hypothetical protein
VSSGSKQLRSYSIDELISEDNFANVRQIAPNFPETFRALSILACKAEHPGQSESDTDAPSRPTTASSSSSTNLNSDDELSDAIISSDVSMDSEDTGLYSGLSGISNISMSSKDESEVQHLKTAFLVEAIECLNELFFLSNWQGVRVRIAYLYFLGFPHLLIFSSTEKLARYYICKDFKPPKGEKVRVRNDGGYGMQFKKKNVWVYKKTWPFAIPTKVHPMRVPC